MLSLRTTRSDESRPCTSPQVHLYRSETVFSYVPVPSSLVEGEVVAVVAVIVARTVGLVVHELVRK